MQGPILHGQPLLLLRTLMPVAATRRSTRLRQRRLPKLFFSPPVEICAASLPLYCSLLGSQLLKTGEL